MSWRWALFWFVLGVALQTLGQQLWLRPEPCRTEIQQMSDGSFVYLMRCSPLETFQSGLDSALQHLKRAEKFINEHRSK